MGNCICFQISQAQNNNKKFRIFYLKEKLIMIMIMIILLIQIIHQWNQLIKLISLIIIEIIIIIIKFQL
jgi:hypothetical protein